MSAASAPAESKLPAPKVKISRKQRRQMRLIREQQEKTTPFFPKASFVRLINETCENVSGKTNRFSDRAKAALQVAAEDEITRVMTGAGALAAHAGRETLHAEDIQLFCNLRKV
jgi:histone H3/H4